MRILSLHGYCTSGKIMNKQSQYMRNFFNCKFYFPNAPNNSIVIPPNSITDYYDEPYYHWFDKDGQEGLDKSINYIKTWGKFDGIFGFSQGSAMATHVFDIVKPIFFISVAGVYSYNIRLQQRCKVLTASAAAQKTTSPHRK